MTTLVRWLLVGDLDITDDTNKTTKEIIVAQGEISPYDPSSINFIILSLFREMEFLIKDFLVTGQKFDTLQISIRPVLMGELRPSFNLSIEAIDTLAKMGFTLDFDPY